MYNEIIFNKRCPVVEHHYHTLVHKSKLIAVTPSSKIRETIMYCLCEIGKYYVGVVDNDAIKIVTKFGENRLGS